MDNEQPIESIVPTSEKSLVPQVSSGDTRTVYIYSGPNVQVQMNKHHFLLVIERMRLQRELPGYGDAWPWIGMAFAFLTALVANDAKDIGFKADTWEAIYAISTALSFGIGVHRLFQAHMCRKQRNKTAEKILEEVLLEMKSSQEGLEEMAERVRRATASPPSTPGTGATKP